MGWPILYLLLIRQLSSWWERLSNGVSPGTFPCPCCQWCLVHSMQSRDVEEKSQQKQEKWKLTLLTHTYSYVGSEMLSNRLSPTSTPWDAQQSLSLNKYTQLATYNSSTPSIHIHTLGSHLKHMRGKNSLGDKKEKSFLYSRFWRFSSGPWGLCLALHLGWLSTSTDWLSETISSFLQKQRMAHMHQSSWSSALDNQGSKGQCS